MAAEARKCPYCGMTMAADQRSCPDCGNPYPFDDDAQPEPPPSIRPQRPGGSRGGAAYAGGPGGRAGSRQGGTGGILGALAPYRVALVLAGVLILIVVVAYVLFSAAMSYFGAGRPDPASLPTPVAGPVLVPPTGGPVVVGPSPSPGTGTLISPNPSPSPTSATVRLKVANTDGQGANMRQRPSTTAPVLRTLVEGTVVEAIGGDTNAEGRNWRNVRETNGQTGWIASELLVPE